MILIYEKNVSCQDDQQDRAIQSDQKDKADKPGPFYGSGRGLLTLWRCAPEAQVASLLRPRSRSSSSWWNWICLTWKLSPLSVGGKSNSPHSKVKRKVFVIGYWNPEIFKMTSDHNFVRFLKNSTFKMDDPKFAAGLSILRHLTAEDSATRARITLTTINLFISFRKINNSSSYLMSLLSFRWCNIENLKARWGVCVISNIAAMWRDA